MTVDNVVEKVIQRKIEPKHNKRASRCQSITGDDFDVNLRSSLLVIKNYPVLHVILCIL